MCARVVRESLPWPLFQMRSSLLATQVAARTSGRPLGCLPVRSSSDLLSELLSEL